MEADESLVAWWTGNNSNTDQVGGREFEMRNGVGYAVGRVSRAFSFDGVNDSAVAYGSALVNPAQDTGSFTIEFWVDDAQTPSNSGLLGWSGGTRIYYSTSYVYCYVTGAGPTQQYLEASRPSSETWHHLALTYDGASGGARLYIDGLIVASKNLGVFTPGTTGAFYLGTAPNQGAFKGLLDEVSLYDRVLSNAEVRAIHAAGVTGKCPVDANQTPLVDAGADFSVQGIGSPVTLAGQVIDDGLPVGSSLSVRWTQVDGPQPAGIVNDEAAQTDVSFVAPGIYLFELSASDGLNVARDQVEVRVGIECAVEADESLVAWWTGNNSNTDQVGGREFEMRNGVEFAAGRVSRAFSFDGVNDSAVAYGSALVNPAQDTGSFTIEFWVNDAQTPSNSGLLGWSGGVKVSYTSATVYCYLTDTSGGQRNLSAGRPSANAWHHFAVTYDGISGAGRIYLDGVTVASASFGVFTPATTGAFYVGDAPGQSSFRGLLDEISLYNRALSASEIVSIYNAGSVGKCPIVRNTAPMVSVPVAASVVIGSSLSLTGTAVDDGLPNPPAALTYAWSVVSGPGTVAFSEPTALQTNATFTEAGSYVLRLTADDSELTGSDDITVSVVYPPPHVTWLAPTDGTTVAMNRSMTLRAEASSLFGAIAQVEFFRGSTKLGTAATPINGSTTVYEVVVPAGFTAGSHLLTARATDTLGGSAASQPATITAGVIPPVVAILTPVEGATIAANRPIQFTAKASGTMGPIVRVEFYRGSTKIGETSSVLVDRPEVFVLNVAAGLPIGTYQITARAIDSSGAASTSSAISIASAIIPPTVVMVSPRDGATLGANRSVQLLARASSVMGSITKVEFFRGATKLGETSQVLVGQPDTFSLNQPAGFPIGSHAFSARATDTTGTVGASAPIQVTVIDGALSATTVEIASPADLARISAPTAITGFVHGALLATWQLQHRLQVADGAPAAAWTTFVTGTSAVGSPAADGRPAVYGELGTFDPTLLLNGIHEIRLVATDAHGAPIVDGPITVIVEGNMKVGAFSLAFEDLSVPVSGIPISVVRTYDSRDARVGDFGPGWTIAINNIRLQKNRHLGRSWFQEQFGTSLSRAYYVTPGTDRIVTIVLPDGEPLRFKADVLVKNCSADDTSTPCHQLPDNASYLVPAREGHFLFRPIGDTTGTLEPLDNTNQLSDRFWLDGVDELDLYSGRYLDMGPDGFPEDYNPTRFRLTTQDGTVFILDERLGLLEMRDLIGNSLVLQRDGQQRVIAIVSTQAAGAADEPITRSVTIHRDATGRVDYIEDLDGDSVDYTYDTSGRLSTVTDRALNVTEFHYENPVFAHYLTKIIDPRGLPAIRCEYDETGRLVKQTDAEGRETVFDRGVDATGRFERIEDRLGHETTYYYDDRGNVTLKIDPEGARTTMSYHPDSDWTRFETDHYGNSKSFAYDSRGNVTVETLGASLTDDPANPTTGYVTRTAYNNRGTPTGLTDPDGRLQTFTYDPASNNLLVHTTGLVDPSLSQSLTASPSATTFTYLDDGSIDTITDALGNVTQHTYRVPYGNASYPGSFKRVTLTVTDPAGAAGSDPINVTDTVLRTSHTIYDGAEKALAEIVLRTLPDGSTEEIVTRHRYDADDRLVATILPDGRVNETRYNAIGKEAASVQWTSVADYEAGDDALARITSYDYDARGNQVLVAHPDGATEAMAFDAENRRLWTQDRRGARTFFEYDKVGRLTATILPDDNDSLGAAAPTALDDPRLADNARTSTIYDLIGRVRFQIDEEGATTEFTYEDGCGCAMRRKEMIQHLPTGNLVTSYIYDNAGNVRFVTDPRGHTVETRYDEQGRPTHVIYPATDEHPATQTVTTYDVLGRRVAVTDQEGRITRYRYDALGRLIEVRQYLDQSLAASDSDYSLPATRSSLLLTRYTYDEAGNQTTQTDALGRTTTYETDTLGRRTRRILPQDPSDPSVLSEVLEYDAWGQLWHRTDFAGRTTSFEYDVLGRLRAKAADPAHPSLGYSNAAARIEYDYDVVGQREAARSYRADGTLLYGESTPHDIRGRLDYKDTAGGRLDYTNYENGLLKDVVSSNSDGVNIAYRYDALNRLAYVDDTSTGTMRTTGYAYNANGSLETVSYANGVTHAYQYDTLNRLRDLTVRHLSTVFRHQDYRLRASGHRHQVLEGPAPSGPFAVRTYDYDTLYRLTGETITGDAHGHDGTVTYALDKVGNRLGRTTSGSELQLRLPTSTSTYGARDWLDGDTYDANGNTLASPSLPHSLTPFTDIYDFENRLIVRIRADGTSVNLAYDADGNRIGKTILNSGGGLVRWTTYLVDTNNLTGYAQVFEERTTTFGTSGEIIDDVTKIYTYGSDLISQTFISDLQSLTTKWFSYDGHGSVRELTDETGTVTDRYDYDAFGVLLHHEGTSDNAYLYCGEQWDEGLQLYFLRSRYLNPDSGRFWNMDTYEGARGDPGSLHKYLYASGNPVMRLDPSGRSFVEDTAFGRAVHREIANDFLRTDPGGFRFAEKYISTVANGRPSTGEFRRIFGTILGKRVDLVDMNGDGQNVPFYIFEVKPHSELAEGIVQLSEYVFYANMLADGKFEFDFGSGVVYTPPRWIYVAGEPVLVSPPVSGVILYMSSKREAEKLATAVSVYGFFRAAQQLIALDRLRVAAGIEARLALSVATRGF